MEKVEVREIVRNAVSEETKKIINLFHEVIKTEVEKQLKNAEKLASFLSMLETQQNEMLVQLGSVCKCMEDLTKTLQQFLEAINKKARVNYAT